MTTTNFLRELVFIAFVVSVSNAAIAEPKTYAIDSSHTYPAFEADHQGGLSLWRGKINSTTGSIVLDREAKTGSVDISMDMATIDFGHDGMNKSATGDIFKVADFPSATYTGTLTDFVDGAPTAVEGHLTLVGVTKPLQLSINQFLCKPHFRTGKETCGADASALFDRGEFGVNAGLEGGFFPEVSLRISVEAQAQ